MFQVFLTSFRSLNRWNFVINFLFFQIWMNCMHFIVHEHFDWESICFSQVVTAHAYDSCIAWNVDKKLFEMHICFTATSTDLHSVKKFKRFYALWQHLINSILSENLKKFILLSFQSITCMFTFDIWIICIQYGFIVRFTFLSKKCPQYNTIISNKKKAKKYFNGISTKGSELTEVLHTHIHKRIEHFYLKRNSVHGWWPNSILIHLTKQMRFVSYWFTTW